MINDGLVTVISCSSASATALNVGVEWFRKAGTSLGVSSTMIAPGATVNFGSSTVTYVPIDSFMPAAETVKSGAARVLSTTTKGLLCNAFVIDPTNDSAQRMMQLKVMKAKAQKGD